MAKKKPKPNLNGLIGGYLRISDVKFPPGSTLAEKEAVLDRLRQVRMSELRQDAQRDGLNIDVWYDDIGISGTGEFVVKRLAYQEMLRDAKARKLRAVYARDLSRLGRDLIEQENFFLQLEAQGVEVRVADLPTSGDEAARTLVRQQLGSLNQYMATKNGQVIKQTNLERVRTGQWVGRGKSMWGLKYNRATKGFDYDPETAHKIIFLYELFVAEHGIGRQTTLRLQELARSGSSPVPTSPGGGMWATIMVLRLVRSEIYRRRIQYEDLLIEAPDLIPEVVPPDLVAEVDSVLALRTPFNVDRNEKRKAGRIGHTYGSILRCARCGFAMQSQCNPSSTAGRAPVKWISWVCIQSKSDRNRCNWRLSMQQYRIDALVGEGLRDALNRYEQENFSPSAVRRRKAVRPKTSVADALALLDQRRDRLLDFLETCPPDAVSSVETRLNAVAAERIKILQEPSVAAEMETQASITVLTRQEWAALSTQLRLVWNTPDDAMSWPKHELMKAMGVQVEVTVHARQTKKVPKEGNPRIYAGLLSIKLHIGILGMTGDFGISMDESPDTVDKHLLWRSQRKHA